LFERHGWSVKENIAMTAPNGEYVIEAASGHGSRP
jgi:hypothetical protein